MEAPRKQPKSFVAVLASWLIPGGGHVYLGRVWPGLFVAAAIIPLFLLGLHLTGYEIVSPVRHRYYFILHAFTGLPAAFAAFLTEDVVVNERMPHANVGTLYTAVAGLLNLMAVADVWARCRRGDPETMGEPEPQPEASVPTTPDIPTHG